jgi:hypothetical protein
MTDTETDAPVTNADDEALVTNDGAEARVTGDGGMHSEAIIPEDLDAAAVGVVRALANAAGDEHRVWSIVCDVASDAGEAGFPAVAAAALVVTFGRCFEGPVTPPL